MRIRIKKDVRCFRAGQVFDLPLPICVLVGESGSGKSTLLRMMMNEGDWCEVEGTDHKRFIFDFEFDSPRIKPFGLMDNNQKVIALASVMVSHGQSNWKLLEEINQAENSMILLDEPETALSPRKCHRLWDMISKAAKRNCQFVIATHSPILIDRSAKVFDLESLRFFSGPDYLSLCSSSSSSTLIS